MKNFLFCLLAVVALVSCGNGSKSSNQTSKSNAIDSIALKDSLFKQSVIKEESNKAIANINFFTSKAEFSKQKEVFLTPLIHTISLGSAGSYTDGYLLGEYAFDDMKGNFYNDSLFNVHIIGQPINYEDYNDKIPKQCEALITILSNKYGSPNEINELPAWTTMSKNDVFFIARWNLGFKNLFVWISCSGVEYSLDFCYYVPELADKKNKGESENSNNINKEASEIL